MQNSLRAGLLLGGSAIAFIAACNALLAQEPAPPPPRAPESAAPTPAAPETTSPQTTAPPPTGTGTTIPQITVTAPKERAAPKRATTTAAPTRGTPAPAARTAAATPTQTAAQQQAAETRAFTQKVDTFNQKRENILPKTGTTSSQVNYQDIANAPGGNNRSIGDVLVTQFPGVSKDATSSGEIHVRNEHANLQYRINGIILPDGVAGFSQFLETSFIGNMALITGALPAQYGLHNTAILDITTRDFSTNQGSVDMYAGSHSTIQPSFQYGGRSGQSEYFMAGRYFQSSIGLNNLTSSGEAIHDNTTQGRFFGYTSTFLDESTRLSSITGVSIVKYQIPNNPGQAGFPGLMPIYGVTNYDSAKLNDQQYEKSAYGVLALQKSLGDIDLQLAYFSRYNSVNYVPDVVGDLFFNGVASNVLRSSFMNGVQADGAYKINDVHTVRAGFNSSVEQGIVRTVATAEPCCDALGNATGGPFKFTDPNYKTGYLAGGYIQDEWRLTDQLTLNLGLRFDQMWQYVDKHQLSPRAREHPRRAP
jgi:hypothetical protein